jgi:hypothetical protein
MAEGYQELISQRQQYESVITQIDNQISILLLQEIIDYLSSTILQYTLPTETKIDTGRYIIDINISPYKVVFLIRINPQSQLSKQKQLSDQVIDIINGGDGAKPPIKEKIRFSGLFRVRKNWEPMNQGFPEFFQTNLVSFFDSNQLQPKL